nr:Chain C, Membrane protein [synthetic construct]3I6G_F Chain F, Membrane protein [synthetic construct]
GLMWLSYFV